MRNATLKALLCSFALGVCTLTADSVSNDKTIAHVLSRVAFGPATADQERVRAIGVTRYIDEQLHPERLADAGMEARLAGLQTLRMTSREIAEQFEIPQLQARAAKKRAALVNPGSQDDKAGQDAKDQPGPEEMRRANQVMIELSEQKLLRAAYSERQLQEVLVDFWFNHFNVDARKGPAKFLLTEYERDAIRPHVLGKFRDLLEATAKSPAMLFYLDNWMSADPNGPRADAREPAPRYRPLRQGRFGDRAVTMPPQPERLRPNGKSTPKGLNENYGRELMELHTLGVDGGYTQQDVTEVARAFTGWTIQNPRLGGGYRFDARLHDPGQKSVLGHVITAGGGESDGEQVLDILAHHPATARFIATALIRRFVSDTPPPALVERAAARFRQTDGDLREVTRIILMSPDFLAPAAYGTKVKTPLEFVVSAIRATNAQVDNAQPLVRAMRDLGMPLYFCQPPTGYKDTADAWVNTGALVSRMNFALDLASGRLRGIAVPSLEERAASLVDDLGESTRSTVAQATSEPQRVALTLGAPEFQRR
jgi:uncharacterized protein (DUF1800 family)